MEDNDFEERKLDVEWVSLNALRSSLGIALRGQGDASYQQALALGQRVAPRLFDPDYSLVAAAQEPSLVREFRQRAEAESRLAGRAVSPTELINEEIARYERLLQADTANDQLERAISRLYRAREHFEDRSLSEHRIIERDVFKVDRPYLPSTPKVSDSVVEFELPFDRALRLRVLHPDRPEHATGADLIYEFCDQNLKKVRVAFMQYKIWDGYTLRFSQARNLDAQLERLEGVCCRNGLCLCPDEKGPPESYRLPYCAAFLRPTDRLQKPDARLISSGLHVPVCVARTVSLGEVGGRVLRRDPLRGRAISQRLFEELFNRNMIGSIWLSYDDLERLYAEHYVLSAEDTIMVHAQEFTTSSPN